MFRKWKKYPKHKPKTDGWYEVTYQFDDRPDAVTVTCLYFVAWRGVWEDRHRVMVFEGYKVYKPSKAPIDDNRVYSDVLCDRTLGVRAWRPLAKPYGWKRGK